MKKIFIIIPDGVGLRNYALSGFYTKAQKKFDVVYWNATSFPINKRLGLPELKMPPFEAELFLDFIKTLRQHAEVEYYSRKYKAPAYRWGVKLPAGKSWKQRFKNFFIKSGKYLFVSPGGIRFLQTQLEKIARSGSYYRAVKQQLAEQRPDLVLSTHQRPLAGLAPVLAAKDLGIPTLGFIFSWDNLPKGTLNIKTEYYAVWSAYMKDEMLRYYPEIDKSRIRVTGTPQFEMHFDKRLFLSRESFFKQIDADPSVRWLLFSGDDKRTSPYDPVFLKDLATAVRKYNANHTQQLGILLRPVPVDFSGRYDEVIAGFSDVVRLVQPLWENLTKGWASYFPTREDMQMLHNLGEHTEAVINVGSSMVFDFVAHNKPTVYLNYNPTGIDTDKWSVEKIYGLIHFRSMPSGESVLWMNNPGEWPELFDRILNGDYDLTETRHWFDKINLPPQNQASFRIIALMEKILSR